MSPTTPKEISRFMPQPATKLQSATKCVETLRPKLGFLRFIDFKRGNIAFSLPSPDRKQQKPQLRMEWTGEGVDYFVL